MQTFFFIAFGKKVLRRLSYNNESRILGNSLHPQIEKSSLPLKKRSKLDFIDTEANIIPQAQVHVTNHFLPTLDAPKLNNGFKTWLNLYRGGSGRLRNPVSAILQTLTKIQALVLSICGGGVVFS
jgi:hypothetical protein